MKYILCKYSETFKNIAIVEQDIDSWRFMFYYVNSKWLRDRNNYKVLGIYLAPPFPSNIITETLTEEQLLKFISEYFEELI